MKRLHRADLYGWSAFNERLDIDFNSVAWIRPQAGNIVIDPLPLSEHDREQLRALGGVAWVVITNSDHLRAAEAIAKEFGAQVAGPLAEKADFPIPCDRWLGDGDELAPGLRTVVLEGSLPPGELALILDGTTLITGDLIRSHHWANALMLLPLEKVTDRAGNVRSLERLLGLGPFQAILVGDGWSAFRDGHSLLRELHASLTDAAAKRVRNARPAKR
jgi:glyoxylase-like metal-dependent hydrolase (beta-lactamase superfamily II)